MILSQSLLVIAFHNAPIIKMTIVSAVWANPLACGKSFEIVLKK